MCRLLMMTGITDPKLAYDFMHGAAPTMSRANSDGLGYSAIDSQGNLMSERWHINKMFDNRVNVLTEKDVSDIEAALDPFKGKISVDVKANYTVHGDLNLNDIRTVTMHTRFATCGKEFANTHPFIYDDTSLVHNGVISNAYTLGRNKISTCDSENALQLYLENDLRRKSDPEEFKKWLNQMTGYWAFGILSRDESGRRVLDVTRNGASLVYCFIPGLGTVFATNDDIILDACKAAGIEAPAKTEIHIVKEDVLQRFDAVTGEQLLTLDVKVPKPTTRTVGSYQTGQGTTNYSTRRYNGWCNGKYGYWQGGKFYEIDDNIGNQSTGASCSFTPGKTTQSGGRLGKKLLEKYYEKANDKNMQLDNRLEFYDRIGNTNYLEEFKKFTKSERQELRMFAKTKSIDDFIDDFESYTLMRGAGMTFTN